MESSIGRSYLFFSFHNLVTVEEHQYETMPRTKDPETTPQKKGSFELTEDVQHYEVVDNIQKGNTNAGATAFHG